MLKRIKLLGIGIAATATVLIGVLFPQVFNIISPAVQHVESVPRVEGLDKLVDAKNSILAKNRAGVPIPFFAAGDFKRQYDFVAIGELNIDNRGPTQPIENIDWSVSKHGRYYATQLHGLVGIANLLQSPKKLPAAHEKAIADVIQSWAKCCAESRAVNARSWYEGTVVKRLSTLLLALKYMRRHGEFEGLSFKDLFALITKQTEFLLDHPNVYSHGNHGIRQDIMLAAAAISIPELPRSKEMLKLAETRLDAAALTLFTKEGIWAEHAPGYVQYAVRLLNNARELATYSDEFNPRGILRNIELSSEFLRSIITPDGRIPWIGVSNATEPKTHLWGPDEGPVRWSESDGRTVLIYPNYGHAVIRDKVKTGLWLLFHASQNLPAGKRHEDALSFLLYNKGRLWITEGGHKSYEPSRQRNYLLSPMAHNTYFYGEKFLAPDESPQLKAGIGASKATSNGARVSGYSDRFDNSAQAERTIATDFARDTVVITDVLRSNVDSSKIWFGHLHFPRDLEITVDRQNASITASDTVAGTEMKITFVGRKPNGYRTLKGSTDPVGGWGISKEGFGEVTSLRYTFDTPGDVVMRFSWLQDARGN